MTTRRAKMQVSMAPQEYDAIYRHCQIYKLKPSKFLREAALAEIEMKMRLVFVDDCESVAPSIRKQITLSERIAILSGRIRP